MVALIAPLAATLVGWLASIAAMLTTRGQATEAEAIVIVLGFAGFLVAYYVLLAIQVRRIEEAVWLWLLVTLVTSPIGPIVAFLLVWRETAKIVARRQRAAAALARGDA